MKKLLLVIIVFGFYSIAIAQKRLSNQTNGKLAVTSKYSIFNPPAKKSYYLPIAFTAYGFSSLFTPSIRTMNFDISNEIAEDHPNFRVNADNYLQFLPAVSTFALKLGGQRSAHNMWSSSRIYLTSTLFMASTVYALKTITHEERPDGSGYNSFPSGHTATAFAAAEFMHQEFKNSAPLLSYTGYLAASATGTLRMYNNKHYLSDVLAGAGIGILATKAAYWLDERLFEKPNKKIHHAF